MTESVFNPYLSNAEPLSAREIDSHVKNLRIAYYGEMPSGFETVERHNHPAIEVPDDSGLTKYSVLVSGDLANAKTVLVKAMAWSDHPGRGFEALREALIADDDQKLAVVGVSFPGTFLTSQGLTAKQKESLNKQDFRYIAGQQWSALGQAIWRELKTELGTAEAAAAKISDLEFVLSGSSQGSVNAVGLLQAKPEWANVRALGLAQAVGLEAQGWLAFRKNFVSQGQKHFKDYTGVNAYNQYPALGPDFDALTLPTRMVTRYSSHVGAVVHDMRRGGDAQRIIEAVRQKDIEDLAVILATGSKDGMARYEMTAKAAKVLNASRLVVASAVAWEGHYHPAMENLANARLTFRNFAR